MRANENDKKVEGHSVESKAKIGLEALRGEKTVNEIGRDHGVHPERCIVDKPKFLERVKIIR